ncbi:methionine ABC transporter ATP-binding protein [Tuanshanicoccus lijuaniae]|uniref:methionine ABC transporter ATP-binding protein n=1 Tax=Aerococcaceae bacterium zg-1292 TaxID=2774330 RepID=UPI001BD88FD2|nr:ATP-binding cassette domain-containing protein [Aerococcaceae bacterium zg-A91]MBS4457965.1 ATP-binding cassette domain-containing protein [Aerococcaceae bacterium zg-BR33]
MIELVNVSKKFDSDKGEVQAVNQLHLTIQPSEIFGLIGQSGAGKSTVLRFINGLLAPDNGEVIVHQQRIHQLSKDALRKARKEITMVFQQFNLLNNLTVEQNIQLPLKIHRYDNPLDVEEVLEMVGLMDKRHAYPSQLSGGQKQRVGIARALISNPKVMLLDEPTSALDEQTITEVIHVLQKIHARYAMTMVVVTHQLSLVQGLCQRVGIMEQGRLLEVMDLSQPTATKTSRTYREFVKEVLQHDEIS